MKFLILLLLAGSPLVIYAQEDSILVLSDIHLSLGGTSQSGTAFYHRDADTVRFYSVIRTIKSKRFSMIILPGDLYRHAPEPRQAGDMRATFDTVFATLHRACPSAIILPAIGNNDLLTHDGATGNDPSYRLMERAFVESQPDVHLDTNSLLRGGYYSFSAKGLKIIVLNSILFYTACKTCTPDNANAELDWLRKTLLASKGERVWLVYHVPPGIDRYRGTERWNENAMKQFGNICLSNRNKIAFQLAGHTHMDDYLQLLHDGHPFSYIHIAPGLDSRNGNNPAYQVIYYKKSTGRVSRINTYYTDSAAGGWHSYSFTDFSFRYLDAINKENAEQSERIREYFVNRPLQQLSEKGRRKQVYDFVQRSKITVP